MWYNLRMDITRRDFVGAALAAGVWGTAAGTAAPRMENRHPGGGEPHLVLGVLSDIHIFDEKQVPVFERALEFFRDRKADGVIIAGDMADRGLVDQLELVG